MIALCPVVAQASACASYDLALERCQNPSQGYWQDPQRYPNPVCKVKPGSGNNRSLGIWVTDTRTGGTGFMGDWAFSCAANLCPVTSKRLVQMTTAEYGPITGGGPHRADGICDMVFTSGAALNGVFRGELQNTGKYTWDVGNGTPPPDAPSSDQPCLVNDLLCFTPGDGSVCGNVGNTKICTRPGAIKPAPDAGGCVAGQQAAAGSWICNGSPTAPKPVDSQGNVVPDNAKIADQTGTVVPSGGQPPFDFNITMHNTNPNNQGGPSNTPQAPVDTNQGKSDENGHCPDGSTPSAGGCNAGYADNGCDAPPMCTGDALLCGQLRETHRAACDQRKFMEDTGMNFKPDELDEIVNKFSPIQYEGDVAWNGKLPEGCSKGTNGGVNCAPGSADTSPVDVASPKIEEKRFWGGRASCPGIPEITLHGQTSDMSVMACRTTGYLGDLVLAGAYVLAAIAFARSMSNG